VRPYRDQGIESGDYSSIRRPSGNPQGRPYHFVVLLPAKARYNPMDRRRPGTNGLRLHPKSAGRSRVAVGGGPRRQEMASQELARIELGEADLILRALRHDEAAIRTII